MTRLFAWLQIIIGLLGSMVVGLFLYAIIGDVLGWQPLGWGGMVIVLYLPPVLLSPIVLAGGIGIIRGAAWGRIINVFVLPLLYVLELALLFVGRHLANTAYRYSTPPEPTTMLVKIKVYLSLCSTSLQMPYAFPVLTIMIVCIAWYSLKAQRV